MIFLNLSQQELSKRTENQVGLSEKALLGLVPMGPNYEYGFSLKGQKKNFCEKEKG